KAPALQDAHRLWPNPGGRWYSVARFLTECRVYTAGCSAKNMPLPEQRQKSQPCSGKGFCIRNVSCKPVEPAPLVPAITGRAAFNVHSFILILNPMLSTMYFRRLKTFAAASLLMVASFTSHAIELPGANLAENDRYDTLPPMIAEALAQLTTPPRNTPAYITEFEQYIAQTVAPSVPGAALLVVADGKVQVMNGYGVRKVGSHDPVTPDTVF